MRRHNYTLEDFLADFGKGEPPGPDPIVLYALRLHEEGRTEAEIQFICGVRRFRDGDCELRVEYRDLVPLPQEDAAGDDDESS